MFDKEVYINNHPDKLEIKVKQQEMVTISLEEYEKLKEENKELRAYNEKLLEFRKNVIEPFVTEKVSEDIIKKIFYGDFKTKIVINDNFYALKTRIGVMYEVDNDPKYL